MPGRKTHRTAKSQKKKARGTIKKRKKAFAKKARKEARKLRSMGIQPKKGRRKLEIPNLCPFKESLLRRAFSERESLQKALEEKKQRKKLERKQRVKEGILSAQKEVQMGLSVPRSLVKSGFGHSSAKMKIPTSPWEHKAMYMRELKQVISESDVVVEVLDARDPLGCRSAEIERRVLLSQSTLFGEPKRLILLLNKIDLVPSEVLSQWMRILRRRFPVIAFKASTQSQSRKGHSKMAFKQVTKDKAKTKGTTNQCVGADALMSLLKNYCRTLDLKASITVGFVGYPNTGKSSVINSLKRKQSVGTSSTPGFTTELKRVRLDSNIEMVDSPGVIVSNEAVGGSLRTEARLVLRNALKLQTVDALSACRLILNCVDISELMKVYSLSKSEVRQMFDDYLPPSASSLTDDDDAEVGAAHRFLFALSARLKHLKSGGVPDIERTALRVLKDWNSGKIAFYVLPPKDVELDTDVAFVQKYDNALDIEALMKANARKALTVATQSQRSRLKHANESGKVHYIAVSEERFALVSTEHGTDTDIDDDVMVAMKESFVSRKSRAQLISDERSAQLTELSSLQSKASFKRGQPDLAYLPESKPAAHSTADVQMT